MSVNGITSAMSNTYAANTTPSGAKADKTTNTDTASSSGVVYEPSTDAKESANKTTTDYSSIVSSMKSELANKNRQLENLVQQLLSKQAGKFNSLSEMYKNLNVDEATRAQAEKDIGEDGYWGVNQTSDRLVSMAKALSAGDPEKADKLIAAIKKGFDQATKAWGDNLPDICKNTIDAAVKKMEDWRDGVSSEQ